MKPFHKMPSRTIDCICLGWVVVIALSGCANAPPAASVTKPVRPQSAQRPTKGNPPFYEVFGKRYFVLPSAVGYQERGVASWYGPGFHAGQTSNGEKFDMYGLTAAHKTLPLPTWVEVTNLRNGRRITVRVNDRGPFKDGRIIDLSYTAAKQLDMLRDGTTFVEVRALVETTSPKTPKPEGTATTAPLFVQAGAFQTETNANKLLSKLGREGLGRSFVRQDVVAGKSLFRVRIGPIDDVTEFDRVVTRLRKLGVADARLASD